MAGDKISIRHKRKLTLFFPVDQDYKEIVLGNQGFLDGTESLFGFPGGPLLSDRVAAIRRQQRLLNPHLILKDIAATPSLATDGGAALLDGSVHNLLVVNDAIHPLTLHVNAKTGKISKLVTLESEPLHRDVPVEVKQARDAMEGAARGGEVAPMAAPSQRIVVPATPAQGLGRTRRGLGERGRAARSAPRSE